MSTCSCVFFSIPCDPFPVKSRQGVFVNFSCYALNALDIYSACAKLIGSKLRLLEVISLAAHYGHLLRVLHVLTDQAMTNALAAMDLTAAQGHIMGFLAHRKDPPCPRDIEEAFDLSHPTVSGLLTRLEKKEFIEFRPDPSDRRSKRIYVLPKGRECQETMHRIILANEEQLVQDFTEDEKEQFARLLDRAIQNMGGNPCKRKHFHKEETNQ